MFRRQEDANDAMMAYMLFFVLMVIVFIALLISTGKIKIQAPDNSAEILRLEKRIESTENILFDQYMWPTDEPIPRHIMKKMKGDQSKQ